jgi:hypothetical protein
MLTKSLTGLLTQGLVKSLSGGVSRLSDIKAVFIGDSYANAIAANATNRDAFTDALIVAGATTATTGDAAQAGANLTENDTDNLWNLSTSSKGALYTSLIDPFADKETYNVGILSIGTNDRSFLPDTTSEADFKTGYEELLAQLRIDFPNVQYWFIYPTFRDNATADYEGMNIVRRVQREIALEKSDCYLLPESYDYTAQDDLHIDDDAEISYAGDRMALRVANVTGNGGATLRCPDLTACQVTDEGLLFTITHRDGNDITVPASTSPEMFYAVTEFAQSNGVLDVTSYDVEKVSSTQIRLRCGTLTGVSDAGLGGTMAGLASTDAEPVVPYDNSTAQLPLQTKSFVPTDTDLIRTLGNIQAGFKASWDKTYATGTEVDTIFGVNGRSWSRTFSTYPLFEATAFDNEGAIQFNEITARMQTALTLQADMMIFGVCEIDTTSANNDVIYFGLNGTTGIADYNLKVLSGNGEMRWYDDESNAVINFGGDYRGKKLVYLIDFHSQSDADFYFYTEEDGLSTHTDNDLKNYTGQNRFILGGGGTIHAESWLKYGDSSTLAGGTTITNIIDELKSRWGIS